MQEKDLINEMIQFTDKNSSQFHNKKDEYQNILCFLSQKGFFAMGNKYIRTKVNDNTYELQEATFIFYPNDHRGTAGH